MCESGLRFDFLKNTEQFDFQAGLPLTRYSKTCMLVRRYVSFFDPTVVGMDVKCLKERLRICGVYVEFVSYAANGEDVLREIRFRLDLLA